MNDLFHPPSPRVFSSAGCLDQRRALAAIGWMSLTFFVGLLTSACHFYARRRFDWKEAIISDLQSPEENPHGYFASAFATALAAVFLFQLLRIFHRRLRRVNPAGARAGSAVFGLGVLGTAAIGCLAPFPVSFETVHVPMALGTFLCLIAGTGIYLFLAARQFRGVRQKQRHRRLLLACCGLIAGIVAILVHIGLTPNYFTGASILTTLALCEWLLCLSIPAFLLLLSLSLHHEAGANSPTPAGSEPGHRHGTAWSRVWEAEFPLGATRVNQQTPETPRAYA